MSRTELNPTRRIQRITSKWKRGSPLAPAWKGASVFLSIVALCIYFVQGYFYLGTRGIGDYLVGTVILLISIVLLTGALTGVLHLTKRIPSRYVWLALTSFCLLFISFISLITLMFIVTLTIIIAFSILGALLYRLQTGKYREAKLVSKVTAAALAVVTLGTIGTGGYWLLSNGDVDLAKPYRLYTMKPADR